MKGFLRDLFVNPTYSVRCPEEGLGAEIRAINVEYLD